ncbi:MAG: hypothetical protein BWY49_00482 [Candidatus Omnitrophica bacterium ADurb.Bin314]|nr:MAG: hypothetical protein BWY49_00482 [Candidatus Omnitrophica bacterium ADurb.Bin314]
MAHEEAFFVVTGLGLEHVHTVDLDAHLAVGLGQQGDVGLAKDHEQVALAGVLEVFGHVQVGVHAGLEHGDAAQFAELCGVGFVVEGAGNQHIKARIATLAGGLDQVAALHGAELGADEDTGALFPGFALVISAFHIAALGTHPAFARPGREGGKGDAVGLVRLLHASGFQVVQNHLREGLAGVRG